MVSDLLGSYSEKISGMVAQATHAVGTVVGTVIDALLGTDGTPIPVKELLAQVGHVVANLAQTLGGALGALLDGGGATGPIDNAVEQVGNLVANLTHNLAQTLGVALDALLRGGDAPDPTNTLMAQALAPYWPSEQINGLAERVGNVTGNLAQAADRELGSGGSPNPTHKPIAPPAAPPLPAPLVPNVPAPMSYSSFLGASGSSTDAFQQLFFVLVLFLVALLQGGKLAWHRREPLRPHSVLRLAVERPG